MPSARGVVGMQKCWADRRQWFAPTTPAGRVWTHAAPGVWTSMATCFYGQPRTRTKGQCTRRGWDAQLSGGPPTLVCTHHARWSRRGRPHYPARGLLWTHTSMATLERARMASARGAVGMQKCWGDARHWFAPATPARRVVNACTTRRVDFYGHILLWPAQNAHEGPEHTARFGRTNVAGTPDTVLHPPRPLVDRGRTHYPVCGLLWPHTSTAPPSTPTNGQCTRGGWNAQMLGGLPTLVFTHHACWSRRGRTHYPACGFTWTETSMATPERPRMASARGAVGTHKCRGDHRHEFGPTSPAGSVAHARTTRRVDVYGPILLWPPQHAHEWPVHAARLGCRNVGGPPDTGLHPQCPLLASWTHALPGVWSPMATYIYGNRKTRTNGQCTRRGWYGQMLGGPLSLFCPHNVRLSRRGRTHYPVCGLLWPHTSMATPVRARMSSSRGGSGMQKCSRDP